MFKISRLTDYGLVVLGCLANKNGAPSPSSARDLAEASGLPLPTVSKLLKVMAKNGLISAKRGTMGGYELLDDPHKISLLRLIEVLEGPPALTSCMANSPNKCQIDHTCSQRGSWH